MHQVPKADDKIIVSPEMERQRVLDAVEKARGRIVEPVDVILTRIKLEPGEILAIGVSPESLRGLDQLAATIDRIYGRDAERVIIFERGQLEFTKIEDVRR